MFTPTNRFSLAWRLGLNTTSPVLPRLPSFLRCALLLQLAMWALVLRVEGRTTAISACERPAIDALNDTCAMDHFRQASGDHRNTPCPPSCECQTPAATEDGTARPHNDATLISESKRFFGDILSKTEVLLEQPDHSLPYAVGPPAFESNYPTRPTGTAVPGTQVDREMTVSSAVPIHSFRAIIRRAPHMGHSLADAPIDRVLPCAADRVASNSGSVALLPLCAPIRGQPTEAAPRIPAPFPQLNNHD